MRHIGRVYPTPALAQFNQICYHGRGALDYATVNGQAAIAALFDHLHYDQLRPVPQFGPTYLPVTRQ